MERQPFSADDASVFSSVMRCVLAEPQRFSRGADLLRERFTLAALRRQSAAALCAIKNHCYRDDQEALMGDAVTELLHTQWRNRDGLLLFHQPGGARRYTRRAIDWRRINGVLEPMTEARLCAALTWARQLTLATITLPQAEAVCLLCWVVYDERAHERQPVLSEFQLLPWESHLADDDRFVEGRDTAAEYSVGSDLVEVARVALAKVDANSALDPRPSASVPADSSPPDATETRVLQTLDAAYLPADEIANRAGVPAPALRKRLDRWRRANQQDWIETSDRRASGPKYLYRWGALQPMLRSLLEATAASTDRLSADEAAP